MTNNVVENFRNFEMRKGGGFLLIEKNEDGSDKFSDACRITFDVNGKEVTNIFVGDYTEEKVIQLVKQQVDHFASIR